MGVESTGTVLAANGLSRSRAVIGWLVALVLASLVTGAAQTAQASDLCGVTIVENLTLDHDQTCTGDGLVVGADGITIDLNGHTLAGLGTGVGIEVTGRTRRHHRRRHDHQLRGRRAHECRRPTS